VILDLWTIERAFAGQLGPLDVARTQRIAKRILGAIPCSILAQAFLRP